MRAMCVAKAVLSWISITLHRSVIVHLSFLSCLARIDWILVCWLQVNTGRRPLLLVWSVLSWEVPSLLCNLFPLVWVSLSAYTLVLFLRNNGGVKSLESRHLAVFGCSCGKPLVLVGGGEQIWGHFTLKEGYGSSVDFLEI